MKHRLSFAYFNILSDNLLELVIDDGIEVTLEMVEECHDFVDTHFANDFGLIINLVNNFSFSYEAKLSFASWVHLRALAFVCYSQDTIKSTQQLCQIRKIDQWNYRIFSGLELGWQQAVNWLHLEVDEVKVS